MELVFPFKNMAFNELLSFVEKDKVEEFNKMKQNDDEFRKELFEKNLDFFRERLPNFENEILQIINTTNQQTIDHYFEELKEDLRYLKDLVDKGNVIAQINGWNKEAEKEYAKKIEKKTNEYFNKEERTKYKHLEQYEGYEFSSLFPVFGESNAKKVIKTNYNFYCIEDKPDLISLENIDEYHELLSTLTSELFEVALKYGKPWSKGEIKSKLDNGILLKPIIFCEGEHDISFIKKASKLLDKEELINKIEIRQRGSCNNLDKLWRILTTDNWESYPQKKILIYDCDTNRENENFGHVFRRTIPSFQNNIVKRGIENLFPDEIIKKAIAHKKEFVDFKETRGTRRGEEFIEHMNVINKQEKKNFCEWVCTHGTKEDFVNFKVVFDLIEEIIEN